MKIAFFTDTYHPSIDGVVRSIDIYSKELRKQGHELRVFAPSPSRDEDRRAGVKYCKTIIFLPYPQYRVPLSLEPCVREAQEFNPDIVHSHAMVLMGIGAKKAARKTGAKLMGTFHTMLPMAGHYVSDLEGMRLWFENIAWKYLQWFYKDGFSTIVCPSRYMQEKISKYKIEAQVLPNPVDTHKFDCRGANSKIFEKNTVLFLGRIAKEKNIDFLVDVARLEEFRTLDAQIVIAGDGPYRAELEKRVKKYNLKEFVKFDGRIAEKNLSSYYSSATCSLFPSYFETQGLTALESLSCSTPVIAIENTAVAEIIRDGKNGYVVSKNPQNALVAIEKCIENKKKMQKECRKTALEYSVEKCTKRLIEKYKKLM